MFLLIGESIGMQELILIGVIALIVFGPRKLPQMAKTIAKTMSEFKNATNEFKSTWEKEIAFEESDDKTAINTKPGIENQISMTSSLNQSDSQSQSEIQYPAPTIKELSASDIAEKFQGEDRIQQNSATKERPAEEKTSNKRNWL